jgi:cell division FtsZ-interacting protein ZapD
MEDSTKRTPGFQRIIDPQDILDVLENSELKTSEIVTKLKKQDKKYKEITQGGVLKVLKDMRKKEEIEGDIERFGFWMWKTKEQETENK